MSEQDELGQLTDDELEVSRQEIEGEVNRRERLKRIPEVIADYANQYLECGGSLDDLLATLEELRGDNA